MQGGNFSLADADLSFDLLRTQTAKLGLSDSDGIAMLIVLAFPARFASVADLVREVPQSPEQAVLSMYVMATIMSELDVSVPRPEAMRFAAVAAERLSRLDPRDMQWDAQTIPRVELCNTLHMHLTNRSEQFYLVLLSLLRRHTALTTRPGSRALRTALRSCGAATSVCNQTLLPGMQSH